MLMTENNDIFNRNKRTKATVPSVNHRGACLSVNADRVVVALQSKWNKFMPSIVGGAARDAELQAEAFSSVPIQVASEKATVATSQLER